MIGLVSAFGAGLLFGAGLWLSGMVNPQKVLGFLDVAGDWDPSLLLVMAGAVAVTFAAFGFTLKRRAPWFAPRFFLPDRKAIDARLVAGAAIFGAGWGLVGYCPGPALTALANLSPEPAVFVAAMVAGGLVHKLAFDRSEAAGREALGEPVKPWTESVAARARTNGRTP